MVGALPIRVLVVEDEAITREHIVSLLLDAGYDAIGVSDASSAENADREFRPDVVLLDILLPDAEDFSLTSNFRQRDRCGVIIVSGIADHKRRLDGLRAGADDYLIKPIDSEELLLKVGHLAERVRQRFGADEQSPLTWRCGPWAINPGEMHCRHDAGFKESLTANEALLLACMLPHAGKIFSRDELLSILRQHNQSASLRAVDSCVSRLRKKLEVNSSRPGLLLSVYGRGYRIAEAVPISADSND